MTTAEEEDISAILSNFSIPTMARSNTTESLLTQSQYAKVIFHDLLPVYPTDADIWCRYTVTTGVNVRHGDRVALYRVGWSSVHDHVQFEMAPVPSDEQRKENRKEDREFQVLFKASTLPKDTEDFFQLCYVNVDSSVCGASVPFQFRRPSDDELCEIEEQEGLLVVRSRTAINEDKLRDATNLIDELEKKNMDHERRIAELNIMKDKMGKRLDELAHIGRHEQRLQEDIQARDSEKNDLSLKLGCVSQRVEQLSSLVDSLNNEKSELAAQLRAECCLRHTETERLTVQLEDMQQMLDATMKSKEMAVQALHAEQVKVKELTSAQEEYTLRCAALAEEKLSLQSEVDQWKENVSELKGQIEKNLSLLKTKAYNSYLQSQVLEEKGREVELLERQLKEGKEKNEEAELKVAHRDAHILHLATSLEQAENDIRSAKEEVDSLRQAVSDAIRPNEELAAARESIAQHERNAVTLRQQLVTEQEKAVKMQFDLDEVKKELEKVSSSIPPPIPLYDSAMQEYLNLTEEQRKTLMVMMWSAGDVQQSNGTDQSASAEVATTRMPIPEDKILQMKECSPAQMQLMKERAKSQSVKPSTAGSADAQQSCVEVCRKQECPSASTGSKSDDSSLLSRGSSGCHEPLAKVRTLLAAAEENNKALKSGLSLIDLKKNEAATQASQIASLERARADADLAVNQNSARVDDARHRLNQIVRRLAEIETEMVAQQREIDAAQTDHRAELNDLHFLNQRMETLQQEVLREDKFQGMDRESEDFGKLERMTRRAQELECRAATSAAREHDAQQICLVLEAERAGLQQERLTVQLRAAAEEAERPALEARARLAADQLRQAKKAVEEKKTQETITTQKMAQLPAVIPTAVNATHLTTTSYRMSLSSEAENAGFSLLDDSTPVPPEKQDIDPTPVMLVSSGSVEKVGGSSRAASVERGEGFSMLSDASGGSETSLPWHGGDHLGRSAQVPATWEQYVALQKEGMNLPSAGSGEAELHMRLMMAAAEYRKVYIEKIKAEKKLARMQSRSNSGSIGEASSADTTSANSAREYVCPICNVTFPLTESEKFTHHFEDHLS